MSVFHWDSAPDGCRVAFSTRLGGVSDGPFRSRNLGLLTGDEPARVLENRRLLSEELDVDPLRATMGRQVHGARVAEARPLGVLAAGTRYEECDGLWTDQEGQPMLLLTADCFPVALAAGSGPARLAVLHVGWRGLLAGIVEAGARAVGTAARAIAGPGIGACCFPVGSEVRDPYRARFGADVLQGGNLDLRLALERALRAAGCERVEHVDRCTACEEELFFSHRRDRGVTGRQGVVGVLA